MKAMNQLLFRTLSARTCRLRREDRNPPDPVKLLLLLSIAGVLAGVLLYARLHRLADMPLMMQGLRVTAAERTLWDVLTGALVPVVLMLGGVLLSGSAAFGQPVMLALLFWRGIAAGLAMAECFAQKPFRQAMFAAGITVLPYAYVSLLILIDAVRAAFPVSCAAARYLYCGQVKEETAGKQQALLFRILFLFLLAVSAAALHTVLLYLCAGSGEPSLAISESRHSLGGIFTDRCSA